MAAYQTSALTASPPARRYRRWMGVVAAVILGLAAAGTAAYLTFPTYSPRDAALPDCNEALRLDPKSPEAFDSRAFVYLRMGKFDRAIADYSAALARDAKRAESLYGRGLAKRRQGDAVGDADIAAAKAIRPDIVEEYARYESSSWHPMNPRS